MPGGGISQKKLRIRGHQPPTRLNPGGFLQKLKMTACPLLALLFLALALTFFGNLSNDEKALVARIARTSSAEKS
jgi:hypothetical protein